ncbi:hypothetical protein Z968_04910 [Clostridium novyi A str. 4552]|uniref:Uncharacterized protein n=1 Tax=Clostridium novyi A str. 4552 TaxID=1444289 RepID=A0A0A0I6I5_CLONO|nr:hypothetical protein [Clostridium novyi]KGM97049.1 hypothetical protein Z968_04910 [Clostridium novyi A str. 4552]
MTNKKIFITISSVLIVATLVLGYYIGKNAQDKRIGLYNNKGRKIVTNVAERNKENEENLKKTVKDNSEILFEVYVNKNNKIMVERSRSAKDERIQGKTVADIKDKYNKLGYKLRNIEDDRIELVRTCTKYKPGRYVLLSENNEIVIGKTNSNGSVFDDNGNIIDKEGTGANINTLKEQDIAKIVKGDNCMQFDSIEQLNDGIMNFDIKYEIPE